MTFPVIPCSKGFNAEYYWPYFEPKNAAVCSALFGVVLNDP